MNSLLYRCEEGSSKMGGSPPDADCSRVQTVIRMKPQMCSNRYAVQI